MPSELPFPGTPEFITSELEEMGLSEEAAQTVIRGGSRGIQKAAIRAAAKKGTKIAAKRASKKAAVKAGGKLGSKLIPFAGEIMMAVDAAPIATEGARKTLKRGREAARETAGALRHGRLIKASKAGVRGAAATAWEGSKGVARTGIAALTARELAEATYSKAEKEEMRSKRAERTRKKAERLMREAEAMTRRNPKLDLGTLFGDDFGSSVIDLTSTSIRASEPKSESEHSAPLESTVTDKRAAMQQEYNQLREEARVKGLGVGMVPPGLSEADQRRFLNSTVEDMLAAHGLGKEPENWVRGMRAVLVTIGRMEAAATPPVAFASAAPAASPASAAPPASKTGFMVWEGETFVDDIDPDDYKVRRVSTYLKGGPWMVGRERNFGFPTEAKAAEAAQRKLERRREISESTRRVIESLNADPSAPVRYGIPFPPTLGKNRKAQFDAPLRQRIAKVEGGNYTEVDALRLMDRANMDAWELQVRMFMRMMERQTEGERAVGTAQHRNLVGFNKADAMVAKRLFTEIAKYSNQDRMPPTRLRVEVARLLARYDEQLVHDMNEGAAKAGFAVRTNPARRVTTIRRNPGTSDVPLYQQILAMLRAIHWKAWTLHWQAGGSNYYGDHLLLQRLYDGEGAMDIDNAIDELGERMVAYFGPSAVDPSVINQHVHQMLDMAGKGFQSLLNLELELQKLIRVAWKANQDAQDTFSLGMDDYLMGLANARDTAIYLLKRRLS